MGYFGSYFGVQPGLTVDQVQAAASAAIRATPALLPVGTGDGEIDLRDGRVVTANPAELLAVTEGPTIPVEQV